MLKALFKKQVYELFALLFMGASRYKTKKNKKSSMSVAGKIVLFAILFLTIFIGMCFMALPLINNIVGNGYDWSYFLLFGFIALLGNIGFNVFVSYNMLFKPKDNSLLLSMPIPPRYILLSRMSVLFLNCILVNFIIWLPAVIMYQTVAFSPMALIFGFLICFVIAMFALTFACLIGWFVAIILKNKITKIILSIIGTFLLISIVVIVRGFINFLMFGIINNIDQINQFMTSNAPFLLYFGNAACGDVLSFCIILAAGLVFFGLILFIMSKTFMFVINSKETHKKKVYIAKEQKSNKLSKALLNKEWAFLFKTPMYLTNGGVGGILNVLLFIGAIISLIIMLLMRPIYNEFLMSFDSSGESILHYMQLIPMIIVCIYMFTMGMNIFGAASISVEGKTFWILKSSPIKYFDIVKAKIKMAIIYDIALPVISLLIFCFAFMIDPLTSFMSVLCVITFSYISTYLNTLFGVLRANLEWKNIAQPVKQNLAVILAMLVNWAILGIFISLIVFSFEKPWFSAPMLLSSVSLFFALATLLTKFGLRHIVPKKFSML